MKAKGEGDSYSIGFDEDDNDGVIWKDNVIKLRMLLYCDDDDDDDDDDDAIDGDGDCVSDSLQCRMND